MSDRYRRHLNLIKPAAVFKRPSEHDPLRFQKHSSGYWTGIYRKQNCTAVKTQHGWRVYLHCLLEPGHFILIEHAERHLMHRIDVELDKLDEDNRKREEALASRPGFAQRRQAAKSDEPEPVDD